MTHVDDDRNEFPQDPLDDTAAAALEAGEDLRTDALQRERDELKDLLLRKSAEFDNYRKRTERDRRAPRRIARVWN